MKNASLTRNIYHAFRTIQNHFLKFAEAHDVTPAQLGALEKLWREDELTVTELGERLGLKTSTVTALADRMERDGLIRRKRNDKDRRVVRLYLTEKGKFLKGKIPNFNEHVLSLISVQMNKEEIKALEALLKTFIGILNEDKDKIEDHQSH